MIKHWRWKQVGSVAACVAATAGLAACGSSDDTASSSSAAGGTKQAASSGGNTFAYLQPLAADPSVQAVTLGMQCQAKKTGDKILTFDANFDQNKQLNQFNTAITRGAKGIVSHAVNPTGMYGAYARAKTQKVAVIDYVGVTDNPPSATHVNEDPNNIAQSTVDALIKQMPQGGKAVMIGGPPAAAGVKPRVETFKSAAKKAGIQILGEEDSLTLATNDVQSKASSLLSKYKDANIIWAVTAATAATAGQVAKQQNRTVLTAGAGASADVASQVRRGTLSVMVDPSNFEYGEAMVKELDGAVGGKPITNPSLPASVFTKDNIDSWVPPTERCRA